MSLPRIRPRSGVVLAASLVVVLAGVLAVRLLAREPLRPPLPPQATVPEAQAFDVQALELPCWSCPNSEGWAIQYRTDLDALAPLGTGSGNAAVWFADFAKPDGPRVAEAQAAMERRSEHPTLGRILPGDDPLLAEAAPWCDLATLQFYPDRFPLQGKETKLPDGLLALTFARSWIARGERAASFDDAMVDFRRVIRLGRLLRQEDVMLINDLVGLSIVRIGAEAVYRRARAEGRMDLALLSAVVAGEGPPQRFLSAARMTELEVVPYFHERTGDRAARLEMPDARIETIRKMAFDSADRRFRCAAAFSLSIVARFGTVEQRAKATETLATLTRSDDPVIAQNARFDLEHPLDEKTLEALIHSDR